MRDDWRKYEGQVVNNKYLLQRFLGSTKRSAVFFTQYAMAQPINAAIKFVSVGAKADSQVSLWVRASQLSHPNLLRLLHAGRCQLADMDLVYVVMEYADENLGHIIPERALTPKETREMLGPLLDALIYLHGKGLAHSHIKPSNVMAIGDQLKLASDTVLPLGEPRSTQRPADAYDAPEAATSPSACPGDVWSLGMTLVETLTQHAPASLEQSQSDPIAPPTLPQPFFDIARQSLRRDPLLRWTTAQIAYCLNPAPPTVAESPAVPPMVATPPVVAAFPAVASSELLANAGKTNESGKGLWVDSSYCWVVICKNHWFHRRPNIFNVHRIPLGETDAVLPRPSIDKPIPIRCDECGREYIYKPSEVLRYEMEVPGSFVPHPLFRD